MPAEVICKTRSPVPPAFLKRAADALLRQCGCGNMVLCIVLTDNKGIEEINKKWFNRQGPTNVVSFPIDDPGILGDVVISVEKAKE